MQRLPKIFATLIISVFVGAIPALAEKTEVKPQNSGNKHIKSKYDKKKNITTVTLKSISVGGAVTREVTNLGQAPQLTLDAFFTYPGEQLTKPAESLVMRFTSRARYPVYQRAQNVVAVLDDTKGLPFGSTTYKTDAQTFYTDEILEITIPYEAMKRMMEVKNLKLLLGNREMIFRDEQLRDLRDLSAAMSPS